MNKHTWRAGFFFFALFMVTSLHAEKEPITILCGGDIMLAHRLIPVLDKYGTDYPFRYIRPLADQADLFFANLENPISHQGAPDEGKQYAFRMHPDHADTLTKAGLDVVSLANNHVLDYGEAAFLDTLTILREKKIRYVGGGKNIGEARAPQVFSIKNQTVAFLAYSYTLPEVFFASDTKPGTAYADEVWIREDVALAKSQYDWVLVSGHWGQEYADQPHEDQIRLAHAAIDAGADAVIGHHPHTVQSFERYKGRPIAYSLGNLVFGTGTPRPTGALMRLVLLPGQQTGVDIFPINVNNFEVDFQPRFYEGADRQERSAHIDQISQIFNSSFQNIDGLLTLQ